MKRAFVMIVAAFAPLGFAVAQEKLPQSPHPTETDKVIREKMDKPADQTRGGETLTEKLDRTDGVIAPPKIDPDISKGAPAAGSNMPVIRPLPNQDMDAKPK